VELREEVRAFLAERRYGVLATVNADGSPQQTVMWYELQGDTVMMNTLRGRRKERNLLRDTRVSLCVEEGMRYVTLAGKIEINEDHAAGQASIAALARRYEGADEAARLVRETFSRQHRVTLTLRIASVDTHGFDGED
jgi:PPOX class probable F420-dependent enzyme